MPDFDSDKPSKPFPPKAAAPKAKAKDKDFGGLKPLFDEALAALEPYRRDKASELKGKAARL